jgi:hypothetical protein
MKRLLRCVALTALAAGLLACAPPRQSVFPPTINIQEMRVLPSGMWHLSVRIQNNSYAGVDFQSLEGQLQIAQGVPIRLHSTFDLDIPSFASDILPLDVLPTPEMSKALQAIVGKGSAGSLAYAISGTVHVTPDKEDRPDSDKPRDFNFHGNDWLSPVPGIANTYR